MKGSIKFFETGEFGLDVFPYQIEKWDYYEMVGNEKYYPKCIFEITE